MKKYFPRTIKILLGICIVILIASLSAYNIRENHISKIEEEISRLILQEFTFRNPRDDYAKKLKLYAEEPVSKSSLGTVYYRLALQCYQDEDWPGYYENFGKAVYYLEESKNFNEEINLYCDLIYYVHLAGGNFDLAENAMHKIDRLTEKYKTLNNQTEALVCQRKAMLAYYLDNYEKALSEAEKFRNLIENSDDKYSKAILDSTLFIISKVNIQEGNYSPARQLIAEKKTFIDSKNIENIPIINTYFTIPFYQISAYLSAYEGNEEKLRFCTEQIIQRSWKYNFEYAVYDTFNILRKNYTLSKEFSKWMDEQELSTYKNFNARKSRSYSFICMGLINNTIKETARKEAARLKNKQFLHLIIILVVFIILLLICSFILRNRLDTDSLTGVNNRRSFDKIIKKNKKKKTAYSVIMIDIDDFKKINDTFGHAQGDKVLKKIGSIILKNSENNKIEPYRYGGEEFAILLYGNYILKGKDIAENLRKQIECQNSAEERPVTISAGFADTVENADANLYKAKRHGKNQVV